MSILSNYDLAYKHLSDADRTQLESAIADVLTRGVKETQDLLTKEVEKAVTSLYNNLIARPWSDVVKENAGVCELFDALQGNIWKLMMEQNPEKASKWQMRELMEAWQKHHPEEFKAAIGSEMADKVSKLEELLSFERRVNQSRY